MNLFRRNPRRLPGTLCDETPAVEAGKWQPRIPVHEVPEPRDDSEYVIADPAPGYTEQPPRRIEDVMAAFEANVIQRYRGAAAPADGPVTAYLRHLLDEITADRDQLEHANGLLVAKVRELTAALAHDTTGA